MLAIIWELIFLQKARNYLLDLRKALILLRELYIDNYKQTQQKYENFTFKFIACSA